MIPCGGCITFCPPAFREPHSSPNPHQQGKAKRHSSASEESAGKLDSADPIRCMCNWLEVARLGTAFRPDFKNCQHHCSKYGVALDEINARCFFQRFRSGCPSAFLFVFIFACL